MNKKLKDSFLFSSPFLIIFTHPKYVSFVRYGLPINFQVVAMQPNRRSIKRLREVLTGLYAHLDSTAVAGQMDVSIVLFSLQRSLFHISKSSFGEVIFTFMHHIKYRHSVPHWGNFSSDLTFTKLK